MKRDDFLSQMPGELVQNLQGQLTFVPHPLPGKVKWTDSLVSIVAHAEASLGKLTGLGQKFPAPKRLMRLFLRREAELSSRIENTYASVRTQLLLDYVPEVQSNTNDAIEVDNNFQALEFGLAAIRKRRISVHLIRQLHAILLKDVRGHDQSPGKFRDVQAHIGRTRILAEARFVPAPPHCIQECMEKLEEFIQNPGDIPRVALLAMIHYQFEAIHPFSDGNGRIGRVLILLLMINMNLLPLPLFNPSAYLESNRQQYYEHLLNVSQRGEWGEWIHFFSKGIIEECSGSSDRIEVLEKLRRKYLNQIQASRSPARAISLMDTLFDQPVVRSADLHRRLKIWPASAQRYIDRLVDMKILREVTGNRRNRVYIADEIVKAFASEP